MTHNLKNYNEWDGTLESFLLFFSFFHEIKTCHSKIKRRFATTQAGILWEFTSYKSNQEVCISSKQQAFTLKQQIL